MNRRKIVMSQTDEIQTMFELPDPVDEYEQEFSVWFATPAWESQGSPEVLFITITTEEVPSDHVADL